MLAEKSNELLCLYQICRSHTVKICSQLKVEDFIPQPVEFVSPPKWHLAHTTWFFEEMILKKYAKNYKEYNSKFCFLFNSYYNTVGEMVLRAERGNMTRPTVQEVYEYRDYIDQEMNKLLDNIFDQNIMCLVILGINHEQQHQELLITDLKYILGHNPLFPKYNKDFNLTDDVNKSTGWIKKEEGVYDIGYNNYGFCYDNELGLHKVFVHEFCISQALVINAEYMEFIAAGGYDKFEYWLDDGWAWKNNKLINSPLYWHKINKQWHHYTLAGLKPINPNALLCHVSYYEANAFANWKGQRLPTEIEWEVAADEIKWGTRWEWTNSAYLPYPKFKQTDGAGGEYNGKFMINQMVLRGSSTATPEGHSRKTYRNYFHPHLQWQFSGIRLVK